MTKRFNNAIGEEYELFKLAVPHYDELQEKIAELINTKYNQKSIKVLEIGCGPGQTTLKLLKNSKSTITAIDNEPVMIEQAKEVMKDFIDESRVHLILGDALEFLKKQEDNAFDVVASGYTIHNFKQDYRKEVLKEIYRILKKEGLFINADKYARDDKKEHDEDLKWQIKQFEVYDSINRSDLKDSWTKHYIEDENPEVIMYEGNSIDDMKSIGYLNIEVIYRNHMEAIVIGTK